MSAATGTAESAQATFGIVRDIFVQELAIDPCDVTQEAKIGYLLDSMERAQLILELEDRYPDKFISDEDMQRVCTIRDLVRYLDPPSN